MISIGLRGLGLIAQILTAFRLISILSLVDYGTYAVYIFEINLSAIFLSFGIISFGLNQLVKGDKEAFYKNGADIILFSAVFSVLILVYFLLKYDSIELALLIIAIIISKIFQNICYAGTMGEKGIKSYNLYLNTQLIFFLLITYIPGITIQQLLLSWLVLSTLNIVLLGSYIVKSFKQISVKRLNVTSLKPLVNKSFYDFNNNLTNRYEIVVLSFFEKFDVIVGLLSVFMQIADSLVNFFKTLAPKIQINALQNQSSKKLHLIVVTFFTTAIVVITLTYNYWMPYLKPDLVQEYSKFIYWSIPMILSIILWSYRFELQSKTFNITNYNLINVVLIIVVCILSIIFAQSYYTLVSIRIVLLSLLTLYTYKLTHKI